MRADPGSSFDSLTFTIMADNGWVRIMSPVSSNGEAVSVAKIIDVKSADSDQLI